MGLLNGGIASIFSAAMGGVYLDATLYRRVTDQGEDDGAGGGADRGFTDGEPVKAQLDQTTQAQRGADDHTDTDQRIIVLAAGVDPISTDDEITIAGQRWGIASVGRDPAASYYDLRGRLSGRAAA